LQIIHLLTAVHGYAGLHEQNRSPTAVLTFECAERK
jgi:hypothetical protein